MSVSSVVVDLAPDADGVVALAAIAADPRFTVGPMLGCRRALVIDTPSVAADAEAWAWLEAQPGIRLVTLVRAYLDDEAPAPGVAVTLM